MTDKPIALILSQQELTLGERGPRAEPGRALVYATRDGRAEVRARRVLPGASGIAFHRVYVVDVSDQNSTFKLEVPSREVPFQFQVELQTGWRATDPVRVVDRRIEDGTSIVRSRLLDRMRPIGAQFSLEDCARAEVQINQAFASGVTLNEGITVHYLAARVFLDQPTINYLEEKRRKQRDHELAALDETHEIEMQAKRRNAIQAAVHGENDLLIHHLAQYPEEGMSVIQHIAGRREMAAKTKRELFERMMDEGLIQDADIDPLRDLLLQPGPDGLVPVEQMPAVEQGAAPMPAPAVPVTAAPQDRPPTGPTPPNRTPPDRTPPDAAPPPEKIYYDARVEPVEAPGPPHLTRVNGVVTWTSPHPRRHR